MTAFKPCSPARRISWLMIVTSLLLGCGMDQDEGIRVSGSSAPTFEIRHGGTGRVKIFPLLMVVQVHAQNINLTPSQEDASKNLVLWKIVADPASTDVSSLERIDQIEYGKVPSGFIQEIPEPGTPAPRLEENRIYAVVGPMSLMRNAASRFKIINNKAVSIPVP